MTWQTLKSAWRRTLAGVSANYDNAPEMTASFASLVACLLLMAVVTGFWSLWLAATLSGAGFAYAGYVNAPEGDEYGADGL